MLKQSQSALRLFLLLTLITGIIYPLIITGIAQLLFPYQANASLLKNQQGKIIGSNLIGQPFNTAGYFWGRPSATTPAYNASASSGSNLAISSEPFIADIKNQIQTLKRFDTNNQNAIPLELITHSASGLDPHISPASAYYQLERVAKARQIPLESIRTLIDTHIEKPLLGFFGEPRINVLQLNLALNELASQGK